MSSGATAAGWAEQQVASVRDDPAGRIALMQRCYYGPVRPGAAAPAVPAGGDVVHAVAAPAGLAAPARQRPSGQPVGMTGIFLSLSRVLPDEYPLRGEARSYLPDELRFGRLLDYGVIVPVPPASFMIRLAHRALPAARPG